MYNLTPDTPSIARAYCPGCESIAQDSEEILEVKWCEAHAPTRDGLDDELVEKSGPVIGGTGESGGEDNRRFCELLNPPLL